MSYLLSLSLFFCWSCTHALSVISITHTSFSHSLSLILSLFNFLKTFAPSSLSLFPSFFLSFSPSGTFVFSLFLSAKHVILFVFSLDLSVAVHVCLSVCLFFFGSTSPKHSYRIECWQIICLLSDTT